MKRHGWAVTAMWMAVSGACLGGQNGLTIAVLNYSEVGKADIGLAVDMGRRILHRMSIETSWHVCRRLEECSLPPAGSYIRLTVIPEAAGPLLGFSDRNSLAAGNPQAYALFGPVKRLAQKTKNETSDVLAYVIAHEVLHVLGLEHAPAGIMLAAFGNQDLKTMAVGPLLSSSQVQQLREGMSRLRPTKPQIGQ